MSKLVFRIGHMECNIIFAVQYKILTHSHPIAKPSHHIPLVVKRAVGTNQLLHVQSFKNKTSKKALNISQ